MASITQQLLSNLQVNGRPIAFLIYVVWLSLILGNCEAIRKNPDALAVVGKKVIDKNYFAKRYREFRQRTGATDNGLARRSMLNNLIAEELLIMEARQRGYDRDGIGRQELERIKIQELLSSYHQRFITSQVTTTDDELKRLFLNLNTKLRARHLYAPTRRQADSLYQLLQQGVTFEEIAKTTFHDPALRESGGLLGYFTVDEMDPSFEEAAFALKVGEISPPVRTNDGYSIIRVEDRISKPLLTETEFARQRHKLQTYWKKRKIAQAAQRYADSLRSTLQITFNDAVIHELFEIMRKQQPSTTNESGPEIDRVIPLSPNTIVVQSRMGGWSLEDFQNAAQYTSPKERSWIRNEENLKDFIAGLVIRSFILEQAKQAKLHKTSAYQQVVAENFDTALLERIEQDLYQEFEIPEDTLRHYYERDPQLFAEPPRVQLQQIQLMDKEKANFIQAQLVAGKNFADLARRYSDDPRTAQVGGDLGYLGPNDLGAYSKQVLALKIGEWIGPLEINSSYVFLKCVDKIPPKMRPYEAVKAEVEKTVRTLQWEQVRQERLAKLRSAIPVTSFPEKLMTIQVN
ncbi:MAG: peptidylprolyl isomerase [candidate division KSB1 bacterium]|nr:peptidylprolyl isomerase [candidate division KSB1 bacterium]MDZ7317967.1 peptidylprolyl isomerase [candidate division KSB1 bacterium]